MDPASEKFLPLLGQDDPLSVATAVMEARRRQQVADAGYPWAAEDAGNPYQRFVSMLGPSLVERTIAQRDAMRAGNWRPDPMLAMDMAAMAGTTRGPIRAYHGSPHDFDRFDMSKIGSGEGAQAYGHGLYFAENEGVARSYRDALSTGRRGADAPVFSSVGELKFVRADTAHDIAEQGMPALQKRLVALDDDIAFVRRYPGDNGDEAIRHMMQEKDELARLAATGDLSTKKGRMYEVNIHADPERFLDWDKPFRGQPAPAQDVLSDLHKNVIGGPVQPSDFPDSVLARIGIGQRRIASVMNNEVPPRDAVESALREAGIPGIKYLDQGSRAAGNGSRNYVVFSDQIVEILRKYGLLPPIAAGAAAAMAPGESEAAP